MLLWALHPCTTEAQKILGKREITPHLVSAKGFAKQAQEGGEVSHFSWELPVLLTILGEKRKEE